MSPRNEIGLPEALERAASALPGDAEAIRPANGDPFALLSLLDSEGATRVLEWLLVHEPAAGGELATEWADAGGDAVAPLLCVSLEGLPKLARKALRRAHHRLRSRGETVLEPARPEVVARLPKVEPELAEAMVSSIDPRGTRIVYLVEAHPSGGARMFVVVLNESLGVVELDVFSAGRSKIKQFIRDFTSRQEYPAIVAPFDSVRALVARITRYQVAERAFPRAFSEWRGRLAHPPEGAQTPGELVRAEIADREDGSLALKQVADWIRDQTIGPWPPREPVLREIAQKIEDASSGVVIVSGSARQEQVDATLDNSIETAFDDEFARRTAERFEETAYFYWKRDRIDDAAALLTAATAFRKRSSGYETVARAMLEVVLAPVLKASAAETVSQEHDEKHAESLLVKP